MKVFGYRDSEISRLYVRSITLTVAVSLVVCQPLIIGGLTLLFRAMLLAYNGNIEIYVPMAAIAEVIAIGFATYLAVALLHIRRIKRVPGPGAEGTGVVGEGAFAEPAVERAGRLA